MQQVEMIVLNGGALILRSRVSELLILPQHIAQLKTNTDPKAFSKYFMDSALVNRPARKLFESWLRKDQAIWARLYKTISQMTVSEEEHVHDANCSHNH